MVVVGGSLDDDVGSAVTSSGGGFGTFRPVPGPLPMLNLGTIPVQAPTSCSQSYKRPASIHTQSYAIIIITQPNVVFKSDINRGRQTPVHNFT